MVSPQNPYTTSEVAAGTTRTDRGFVTEPAASAPMTTSTPGWYYPRPTYYWGSVIAGTLFAMSFFVTSFFLMLGCHVGVDRAGMLSMGWGAAWWICVTSAIAYYLAGAIANSISRPVGAGWLKGATIWGLSIPLTLCIWGIVAGGSAMLASLGMGHFDFAGNMRNVSATAGYVTSAGVSFGPIWTAFTALIVGLIFAIFGSSSTGFYAGATDRPERIE